MTQLQDLSNEVFLQIFPHCPLKSLIAAQGVSQLWRQLVPLADISPARRGLLKLYLEIIESPVFIKTRPWLLENLRPFDREACIHALLDQHDYLPEDFRIWILEWPAKAVIACCWPGLPEKYYGRAEADGVERIRGCNFLGRIPPVVHTVKFISSRRSRDPTDVPVSKDVPVLLVWEQVDSTYLALSPSCSYGVYTLAAREYTEHFSCVDSDEHHDGDDEEAGHTDDEEEGEDEQELDGAGDENAEEDDEEDEEEDDDPDGFANQYVCTTWTYWLKLAFMSTVTEAKAMLEQQGTSAKTYQPFFGPGAIAMTDEEWFRSTRFEDKIWVDRAPNVGDAAP